MSRTNIDLDDGACEAVMHLYRLTTKRDAVNFALRAVAAERLRSRGRPSSEGLGMGWRPRRAARNPRGMILIDTSAWIEFLRDTGSPTCRRVDALLPGETTTCHPVRMEVLAGARDEVQLRDLRGLLGRSVLLQTEAGDFEAAAALYRRCRRGGETVRRLIDCLIAAHAIRAGVPLLHADADFDVLARHTELVVERI